MSDGPAPEETAPAEPPPAAAPPEESAVTPAPAPSEAAAPAAPAAPASAEPAPVAATTAPASPPWTPPETFADRFSRWSVRAVRGAVATFGLGSLVCVVLWVIPTVAVSRSDAYRLARERVANDPMLQRIAGAPIVCDRVPTWYDVRSAEEQRFRFEATCPNGRIMTNVRVKDGKAELGETYLTGAGF